LKLTTVLNKRSSKSMILNYNFGIGYFIAKSNFKAMIMGIILFVAILVY